MSAGPELRSYQSNLTQSNQNVRETRKSVAGIDDKIDKVEMAIDAIDAVERKANEFSDTISKLKLNLKLMDKAGPLKLLAKAATKVLDGVQNVTKKVRDKAKQLAKKIDDSKLEEKLDAAQAKLKSFDLKLAGTEQLLLKNTVAVSQLITALDKIDQFDPNGDPAAPAAAGADALVSTPNDVISALNATFAEIKEKTQLLDDAVPSATFLPVLGVRLAFDSISSSLSFLRGPLNAAAKVLKPIEGVLDAVGFVFNVTVGPVIDYIMNTLGINNVINSASNKINKLLPNPGIFDNILEDFDAAFLEIDPLGQAADHLGISAWLDNLTQQVLEPVGNSQTGPIGIGTTVNDTLTGTGSHNLLYGGEGDDVLRGEAGIDVLLGSSSNDFLDGGGDTDIAIFRGNFTEYNFAQSSDGSVIIFSHLNPSDPRVVEGTDEIRNIEFFAFADFGLTRSQLLNSIITAQPNQAILNGTEDKDFLFAGSTAITINGLGGNDMLFGSPVVDTLNGDAGDDILVFSGGEDAFFGGEGNDSWWFPVNNETGNPTIDADMVRSTIFAGSGNTTTLSSIENIVVEDNRQAFLFGDNANNRLIASTGRDLLDGRSGNDLLDGGQSQDILIGGPGNDTLYGGEGNDALVAGEQTIPGISNFYDGGEGDFDVLTYASSIRGIVGREYINDSIRVKAQSQQASDPVRIFAETGQIERLSADGSTVIANDIAVNVEQFVGSDFNDTLYGGSGIKTEIHGGLGNDTLYGQLAGRFVGGGQGNDVIYAGLGGARYDGGGGFDTLYLTESPGVRWLVKLDGSIGSTLRAFNALEGNDLATPDGTLQNESGPSVIASGNVTGFDVYFSGDQNDYFDLRDQGEITVHGAGGNDFIRGNNGGSGNPSFNLFGELGDDTLILKDDGLADGGAGNDRIEIDVGSSHQVRAQGGEGDDVFVIRSGQVAIDGGAGRDVLSAHQTSISAGFNVDLLAGSIATNNANTFFAGSVTGVEELIGANTHADLLRGSNNGERLIGAGGNDRLEGRGGQDALYGGSGNDALFGDDGNDLLHGGAGNDAMNGGAGIDTVTWAFAAPGGNLGEIESTSFGNLQADLVAGSAIFSLFTGGQENNTVVGIENIIGGDGNDTIRGDSVANMLAGGAGSDLLDGREGNDILVLDGNDTVLGATGDDQFVIGLGNMTIDGGEGNDILDFGTLRGVIRIDSVAGTYTATLETEQPVWENNLGSEPRTVNGIQLAPQNVLEADATFANSSTDIANFASGDTDLAINFVTTQQSVNGTFTNIEQFISGAAKLIGSAANDRFGGDAGNNKFEGLQGNDYFDGGEGADTAYFSNPMASYTGQRVDNGFVLSDQIGTDGQDTLINIERGQFSDVGIAFDLNGEAGQVAKLLGAVFGRESVSNREFVGIGLDLLDTEKWTQIVGQQRAEVKELFSV